MTHDLLGSVFTALHNFTPDDGKALFVLEGLATIEKIQIIIALLPEDDIQILRDIIRKLEAKDDRDISIRLTAVRSAFGLN